MPIAQAGLFAGMGAIMILFWIIGLLATVFWIWMLIDCLTSSLPTTEKLIWAIVIVFTHIVGALIYYFVRRGSGSRTAMT
jgi:hypothetical protein